MNPEDNNDENSEDITERKSGSRKFLSDSDEDEEEEETEDSDDSSPSWREARHLDDEKPDSESDLEIETHAEHTEDQEVVDDPVRMYLHEIGRVHLLTADEEKDLARKMEEGRRIKEIKQDYLIKKGRDPSATEIIITILEELSQASATIDLLQEKLRLTPATSFLETIATAKLRESIDSEMRPQLILAVAHQADTSIPEAENLVIKLSLNINLLPREVLDIIGEKASLASLKNRVTKPSFLKAVKAYEQQLQVYLDNIELEADRAEGHLTEANLRLVVSVAKKHIGRGMSLLDLIQEGNIGLLRAVEKFDYRKGYKPSPTRRAPSASPCIWSRQ